MEMTSTDSSRPGLGRPDSSTPRRVLDVASLLQQLPPGGPAPFRIETPELYELLTYGDGLPAGYRRLGLGSWNRGDDLLRTVMTYLAQRAFAIHRLPWHHDRSCTERSRDGDDGAEQRAFDFLRDAPRLERACADLRRLQAHTQAILAAKGATHVRLRRGLVDVERTGSPGQRGVRLSGYATRTATLATLAQRLQRPHFDMPVDVLTSWSSGGYSQYDVVIEHEVPIGAVLCFSAALASWAVNAPTPALESGEWVVLNRAIDGRLRLSASCVVKCALELPSMTKWSKKTLLTELAQLSQVYGPAASMYRDGHYGAFGRLPLAARLRRAWGALTQAPL